MSSSSSSDMPNALIWSYIAGVPIFCALVVTSPNYDGVVGAGIKPPHCQIEGVINPLNATVCHCLFTPGNRYLVVQHEAFGHP